MAAIAQIFVSPIIEVLFEKVVSGLFSKFAKCGGIHQSHLQKWKKTLFIIGAVLADAEDKQITKRSVQLWLDELQDLAYDLDDIIDELLTKYSRQQLEMKTQSATATATASSSSIPSFTPTAIMFNYDMGSKLEDITNRLQDLVDQKQYLGLKEDVGGIRSYKTQETTCLVVESRVWGRQTDKDKILELVCKDDEEVSVIPIVGMGGLGKTTLAQLVYNDERVQTPRFDLKAWVCVSDVFDEFMIARKIFEWVSKETCNFESLSMVQQSLKEKLSNKKFLLVLDDVWNENYGKWDLLRTPFLAGAPGSKIIVTTRNEGVASIMRSPSIPTYHLTQLTKDDCVSILAQHALGARDFEAHPKLKVVGEDIARKCNGSPLAAKTLGGLLRTELSTKAWENVLNSKFWKLPAEKSDIFPALRLSYHHLPPHLKQLFTYCSIFPKDYQFDKFELVLLWMAEGFLRQAEEERQMEEIGFQYFNELLSRSFFQHSSGDQSQFVMHDLMNDLAQFVAGRICFSLDDKMISNEVEQQTISKKARHSSSIRLEYGTFNKFEAFYKARSLRTFLTLSLNDWGGYHLSNKVVHELLLKLQCLRVLNLSGYSITELPNSIGDLRHLRYLNLSKTLIKQLPESVSNLFNLETLLLRSCRRLNKLPAKIGNLINLRHLDASDTEELQEMPSGIGTLISLRTLSKIILDESNMLKITELRGISNLIGALSIVGLQHVKSVKDAMEANMLCKQGLEELMLIWSSEFNDSRNEQLDHEVLAALRPHTNLTKLKIVSYGGIEFSSWVGDRSFSNITHLTLEDCEKCTSLPPVGQLPSLRELCVWKMSGLKNVGVELCGNRHAEALSFPSLEILNFGNMDCWEEWLNRLTDVDRSVGGLYPRLRELTLRNCPKLVEVILPRIPSLRVLNIENCCEVVLSSMVRIASSVKTLKISGIRGLISLRAEVVQSLASLEDLTIEECYELSYLWQEESVSQNLVNLKCLSVRRCPQLVSLAKEEHAWPPSIEELRIDDCEKLEKLPIWGNNLMSLRKLDIRNCPGLQSCPTITDLQSNSSGHVESFPHLEHLTIRYCSSLTCLPTGQNLPTSVKSIWISNCSNLEPDSENFWLHSRCIPSLEEIFIVQWMNLKVLPGCLLSFNRLTTLKIYFCPGLESFPEIGLPLSLRHLQICYCENLKSMPDVQMQSLTSLEYLSIRGCPSLESFPGGVWPPNLRELTVGEVKQPISEWGLPTSLVSLEINGKFPEVVSLFPDTRSPFPTSLTTLTISHLVSLESLSMGSLTSLQKLNIWPCPKLQSLSMGLQNLTSLQELHIHLCPKLQSLPEKLLPTLSSLTIFYSQLLEERCLKEKGPYWPLIAHIPCVEINDIKQ